MLEVYTQPRSTQSHSSGFLFGYHSASFQSLTLVGSIIVLLILAQLALVSIASAQGCQYSPYWGEDGELWDPNGPLKDYSYVGYHQGEDPIPYQQRSASKTFGAGRFTITSPITITHGVLRGAGKDKTILYFPKGLIGMGYISQCVGHGSAKHCDWDPGVIRAIGSEIGIEDLTVEFPPHSYKHHNGQGFNGPTLETCTNCWIKNVRVVNADEGFGIQWGAQNTIDSVEVIGGYHNYIYMTGGHNNLVTNFVVSGRTVHGLSGNWDTHGGVYSNGWGDPVVIEPNHNGPTTTNLLYSNIQGTGGKKSKMSNTFLWNYMKQNLCPLDIHQAQLDNRLGITTSPIASGSGQTVLVGQVVRLDGEGNSAPDGDARTFQGDFGDSSTSQALITHTDADVGTYALELTISDDAQHGNFSYRFDVPRGAYDVTLHFAEPDWQAGSERLFDLYIEGTLVLENYDISAAAGHNVAAIQTFPGVVVDDGHLSIDVVAIRDIAANSAIEVR